MQNNAAILANELRKHNNFFTSTTTVSPTTNFPSNPYQRFPVDRKISAEAPPKSPKPVAMTEDMYRGLQTGELVNSGLRVTLKPENSENPPVEVKGHYCAICRCIFLDDVVFAIHKAAHSYKNPLQCNLCGHQSESVHQWYAHFMHGNHKTTPSGQNNKKVPDASSVNPPWNQMWYQNGKK